MIERLHKRKLVLSRLESYLTDWYHDINSNPNLKEIFEMGIEFEKKKRKN